MYAKYVKRGLCFLFSITVLIAVLPLLILVALMIKLDSKGPVLFWQERLGRNGKVFRICKFRSMTVGAEHTGSGVYSGANDSRVTRVGKIIRALSIDELPQLYNTIRGDMSLIGFRPPLTYHPWPYDEYTSEQKRMFEQRPGITGWAQIHGRKTVQWVDRIDMSVWYANNVSLWVDIKIFFMTIVKVIASADNENVGSTVEVRRSDSAEMKENEISISGK